MVRASCVVGRGLAAALAVSASSSAHAIGSNIEHPWDYVSHAMGGYVITDYMQKKGYSKLATILMVSAVAVAKEASDKNFDNADAAAWLPGVGLRFSFPLD